MLWYNLNLIMLHLPTPEKIDRIIKLIYWRQSLFVLAPFIHTLHSLPQSTLILLKESKMIR